MIYIILTLGLIIRLLAITKRDFWLDEALTYHFASLPLTQMFTAVLSDNNPPFYYLLIHFVLKISQNETILRLPSLLFNLLTIYLLYKLFKRKLNGKIALYAAGFYSVSPLSVYIATEARLHSLAALLLVILTSSYLSLILSEKTPAKNFEFGRRTRAESSEKKNTTGFSPWKFIKNPNSKNIIIFAIISILALFTQYYLALIFIPMTLIIIFKKQKAIIKKWFLILFICTAILSPWLIFSLQSSHNGCWCPPTLISFPATLASPSLAGVGIVTMRSFLNLNPSTIILFTVTGILSILLFLKGFMRAGKISLFYFVPLSIISIFGFFLPIFSPKGFSIFAPLFFLITAFGVSLSKNAHRLFLLEIFLLSLVTIIQIVNPHFYGEKLKEISGITSSKVDIPVFHTSISTYYSSVFYNGKNQKQFLLVNNPLKPLTVNLIGGRQTNPEKLQELWLVDYPKWSNEASYNAQRSKILLTYNVKLSYSLKELKIYLMQK